VQNRVFEVVYHRARGFLPFLPAELVTGAVPGAVLLFVGHAVIGPLVCAVIVALLVLWRRRDFDRSDYVKAWWRRRTMPAGFYAAPIASHEKWGRR
jgi:hypothetical protein